MFQCFGHVQPNVFFAFVGCIPLHWFLCVQDLRAFPHVWVCFRGGVFNNMSGQVYQRAPVRRTPSRARTSHTRTHHFLCSTFFGCVQHFRGALRWTPPLLHWTPSARPHSAQKFRDAGLRVDGSPASKFWEVCLGNTLSSLRQGDLERHKRDRVIPSYSHSDKCEFESIDHFPPNIPNSSHSTQLHQFEDNVAVIRIINKRPSKLEARHKNAQS